MNRNLWLCLSALPLMLLGVALCGCGGGGGAGGGSTPPPPPPSAPVLTSLQPASVTAGNPAFTLTVNGSNFAAGATVQWNGAAKTTTVTSSAVVTANILAADVAQSGTAKITVTNPGSAASNALDFTITANPQQALDQLPVNHIVYAASQNRIFASVPSRAGEKGNSIAVIDPTTLSIESIIPVGSEPNVLGLSRDGNTLYVGLDGVGAIRKVDLVAKTAGIQFPIGSGDFGTMYANDIAVAPGSPEMIAVSRRYQGVSPSHAGVAVFDSGVQRATTTPGHTGANRIEFGDSASMLYGYNNETTEYGFRRMKVDASGVSVIDTTERLVSGFDKDIVYDAGLIYGSDGHVIDPGSPAIFGMLSAKSIISIAPDSASGRVYVLTGDTPARILAFNSTTMVPVGSLSTTQSGGWNRDLVRCGPAAFAFVTREDGRVVIVNGAVTPPPAIENINKLPANHLVYDAGRQKIYASVPSRAGQRGNSITIIDPATSTIETSVFIGSEPNAMAMSKDGKYLYVALDGAGAIRRFDLGSRTPGPQFSLSIADFYGPTLAEDIAVAPDNSDVIAVARFNPGISPRHAGVAIYDNGVQRSNTTPRHTGSNRIEFSDSGSTLYGYNNETTDYGFRRMKVDSNGVSILDNASNLISGFGVDILYDAGLVFATSGAVLDPATDINTGLFKVGYANSVVSDATADRVYFLASGPTVVAYDRSKYIPAGVATVQGVSGTPHDLLHFGSSSFAFATSNDQVVITNLSFTPVATPALDKLHVNHLVYDSSRNKIYASVPSDNGALGNSIAVINPPTASIESSIFVGSEPHALAISGDGAYLYVGLDGVGAVRRIDLSTRTAGLQFGLGADSFFGPMYAEDISVMPGNSGVVAISRRYKGVIPRHAGVAIYDNGVRRSNATPTHTGSNVIEFSDSASTLYGYNNETTEFGFRRMSVDANGVSVIDSNSNLISGFSVNMAYDSGLVYATTGAVVDPATNTLVGKFPGISYTNGVLPDASAGRVYFLGNSGNSATILGYNKSSLAAVGSVTIPGSIGPGRDFVRWGATGFAVATDTQVIITSGLLPQPKPLEIVTSTLPPTMVGKSYDFSLTSVGGTSPVTWGVVGSLPPGLTLSPQGRISGTVANGAAGSFTFTVQATDSATPVAAANKSLLILVKTGLGSNNSCTTATPISFGHFSASLSPYGDIDVYEFNGIAGSSVSIETIAQRRQVPSYADTVLELLDSSCSQLAINDDLSSSELDSRIAGFTLPYTGKYYVRVSDARGDGRPDLQYDLVLTRE